MAVPLVLLRHGESVWNRENRFTGWTDVGLTEQGVAEAHEAAVLLADGGFSFDRAHTSVLTRAIQTLDIVLLDMGLSWIPVCKDWRLNERHYGALQGLNKKETTQRYGEEQVAAWRRSYLTRPPALDRADPRHPRTDRRYASLSADLLPATECLADVVDRMLPYWHEVVVPDLRAGMRVIIAAHGNSLRALVKHLDGMSDEAVVALNIPTGVPLVYRLDDQLVPLSHRYLGDPVRIAAATRAVEDQAR